MEMKNCFNYGRELEGPVGSYGRVQVAVRARWQSQSGICRPIHVFLFHGHKVPMGIRSNMAAKCCTCAALAAHLDRG